MEKERIQKILSELGVCSRRKAEQLLADGQIVVNGVTVTEPGFQCLPTDAIIVSGKPVSGPQGSKPVYLMINKPVGVVSTASDPQGRRTVIDLVPQSYGRLFPVGRLDQNSCGLLILTNDGEFANLVTHPSSAPEKEYLVAGDYPLSGREVDSLAQGLYITREGYTALPCHATVVRSSEDSCLLDIVLQEGKKREIRHMMETLGHPVTMLIRIRVGPILLGKLPQGQFKEIPLSLIEAMKEQARFDKAHNDFQKEEIYDE